MLKTNITSVSKSSLTTAFNCIQTATAYLQQQTSVFGSLRHTTGNNAHSYRMDKETTQICRHIIRKTWKKIWQTTSCTATQAVV